jgi:hypothetical protein
MTSKTYETRWDFPGPYFIKEFRRVSPTFQKEFLAPHQAPQGGSRDFETEPVHTNQTVRIKTRLAD